MFKKAFGLLAGILTAIIFTFFLLKISAGETGMYAALLFGSGVAGFICKGKGWFHGGIVGFVVSLLLAASLAQVSRETSGGGMTFTTDMKIPELFIVNILIGSAGGFLGQIVNSKIRNPKHT